MRATRSAPVSVHLRVMSDPAGDEQSYIEHSHVRSETQSERSSHLICCDVTDVIVYIRLFSIRPEKAIHSNAHCCRVRIGGACVSSFMLCITLAWKMATGCPRVSCQTKRDVAVKEQSGPRADLADAVSEATEDSASTATSNASQ